MAQGKTVLVLGGGIGGTVAATRLRKMLPDAHRVVMVEREPQHIFSPSYLWVMVGQRSADRISRPMAAMAKRGLEVVQGVVEEIECAATVAGYPWTAAPWRLNSMGCSPSAT